MSDIKSKKAKQHIKEHILDKRFNDGQEHPCVRAETAVLAIYYAEQEAEQRHQQQLQELRDRAVEVFKDVCSDGKCEDACVYCDKYHLFTQKLTEK